MKRIAIIIFTVFLLSSCGGRHKVTDTKGPARKIATNIPETPFILEGDYTPEIGVTYKVIIGEDTCFVVVDSLTDDMMYGHYYKINGLSCAERHTFSRDIHWKEQRQNATVYLYQEPEYTPEKDPRFRKETYNINMLRDVQYGQANGYWISKPGTDDDSYAEIVSSGLRNSIFRVPQSLTMDIYLPDNSDTLRPFLMLLHGGGFYVGDKQDSAIVGWCRHFAAMGYVTASANYRMGFLPAKKEITRTGYMALQDAHAAMRFLVEHAKQYNIDTNLIFVGGASAGSITALNLAFMREKDRPRAVYERRRRDLGPIDGSGNNIRVHFHIKAVANMWGALTNLNMLKNSQTDIISFHGDADQVVPYDNGFPFNDISEKLGEKMFDRMYGSVQIDKRIRELGRRSWFYSFPGEGHSLHHHADGSWNQKNFEFIRDKMTEFFFEEIVGHKASIEEDRNDQRHFLITTPNIGKVSWKVDGGYIIKLENNEIWVVWRDDSPSHKLRVTGKYKNGIPFEEVLTIDV